MNKPSIETIINLISGFEKEKAKEIAEITKELEKARKALEKARNKQAACYDSNDATGYADAKIEAARYEAVTEMFERKIAEVEAKKIDDTTSAAVKEFIINHQHERFNECTEAVAKHLEDAVKDFNAYTQELLDLQNLVESWSAIGTLPGINDWTDLLGSFEKCFPMGQLLMRIDSMEWYNLEKHKTRMIRS